MKSLQRRLSAQPLGPYICRRCTQQLRRQRRGYATAPAPEIYDVVCVGGGPAGLSLLAALRASPLTSGLKTALIESQSLNPIRSFSLPLETFSNRCSSLTPASVTFLNTIGAWQHIKRERVQAYEQMQVWDGVTDARITFDWPANAAASQPQGKTIAYMTENLNLTSALLARIDELGGVDIFEGTKVEEITQGEETDSLDLRSWPIVHLSGNGNRQLAARLLIGADGANSPVRSFAGIESRGWDYNRHGVVATLTLEHAPPEPIAYQRFLPTGPCALLPLPNNKATLVWSTTPDRAALLKSLSPEDFLALVNAAFRLMPVDIDYMHTISSGQADELNWRTQHTSFPSPPLVPNNIVAVQEGTVASFPLRFRHADTYIGQRVALVGDAAHTVHPLAGQGLNMGQGDVEALVGVLADAVSHGADIGGRLSLEPYVADRYATNHLLMGVMDKLHKVYSVGSGPLVGLRSLGLRAVDALGPLKGFLMSQAAGAGRGSGLNIF